jgi:hypothetical protein
MATWGQKGGRVRSEKKARAARRNLALRKAAQPAPEPPAQPVAVPQHGLTDDFVREYRTIVGEDIPAPRPVLFVPRKGGE